MKKLLFLALIAISVTAQSQTTVPLKVTGTVVATPTGTQAISGTVTVNGASTVTSVSSGTVNIGGFTTRVSVTPTISASPDYSSGDNVGGIQTIANAVRTTTGSATLYEIEIWDKAAQNSAFTIDFWDASPSGTYTDNSAEIIAGDDGKYLGSVFVSSADWVTTGAVSRCSIKGIGLIVRPSSGTTIYSTVITTSVPNQASTSDLIFKYSFIQD